jgi:hypothetical protein
MSELDRHLPTVAEERASRSRNSEHFSMELRPPITSNEDRLAELENENSRLHRLVAELLIKNEQLRKPL